MSGLEALVLLGIFFALLAAPFAFGAVELRRQRDAGPLEVRHDNARNPRQFAVSFREKVAALERGEAAAETRTLFRRREPVETGEQIELPPASRRKGVIAARRTVVIGERSHVAEVYAAEEVLVGAGSRVRALACDGTLVLDGGCLVERWVDGATVVAGPACDLGVSASAQTSLTLAPGCSFSRLWGLPVVTVGHPGVNGHRPGALRIQNEVVWARDRLTLPPRTRLSQDIVAYGGVELGAEAVVEGTVKAHGPAIIGPGARITGQLIARGDVRLGRGACVDGNVFSEGHVHLAPGVAVGVEGSIRSVYSADRITIAPDVRVHGWIVAERRGLVVG